MAAIAFQPATISIDVFSGDRVGAMAYFLCLQGPQDSGTRFLLRTTLNWASGGDWPALDDVVEGGVGGMVAQASAGSGFRVLTPTEMWSDARGAGRAGQKRGG